MVDKLQANSVPDHLTALIARVNEPDSQNPQRRVGVTEQIAEDIREPTETDIENLLNLHILYRTSAQYADALKGLAVAS
jgi:hypothetical protein